LIEVRNRADGLIFTAEKSLKDLGEKVPADLKSDVEGKISALREALKGEDKADMEAKTQELSDHLSKIGETMQNQAGQPGGQASSGDSGGEQPSKETSQANQDGSEASTDKDEAVEGEVVN